MGKKKHRSKKESSADPSTDGSNSNNTEVTSTEHDSSNNNSASTAVKGAPEGRTGYVGNLTDEQKEALKAAKERVEKWFVDHELVHHTYTLSSIQQAHRPLVLLIVPTMCSKSLGRR
jgi:uncharacterized membrane protein YdfJ with MMPL/SSD domain